MTLPKGRRRRLSYYQIIALGFLLIILCGGLVLSLPVSSRAGVATPLVDSLFTATSATCVTGLIVYDTYLHWSALGQCVILLMIQIGGIGFVTVMTLFSIALKRQISLRERRLIMQSAGTISLSGTVRLIKQIVAGTLACEGVGAALLAVRFIPRLGVGEGLFAALFHAVSAFCNAGFDLMGRFGQFSSLTTFRGDTVVNATIMALVLVGGLGFFVWSDLVKTRFKWKKLTLHSRVVLQATILLTLFGAALFLLLEWDGLLAGMGLAERLNAGFFMSVTPRTAGFNTVDLAAMSEGSLALTMLLMFVGGGPGSTAGGVKTTTLVALLAATVAAARHRDSVLLGKRRLEDSAVFQALSIVTIYIVFVMASVLVICAIEPLELEAIVFETISAASTVGLTVGITPKLCGLSKLILALLMYSGRVGGLTLALTLAERRSNVPTERPIEKILIG